MLETRFPRPRGDIGHPQTFDFPVLRRVIAGATPERVVRAPLGSFDAATLQPFLDAAHFLIEQGCTAISTSCGFLALAQQPLQAALPVPVWTSSLLQLSTPVAAASGGAASPRFGVITIEAASLTPAHFMAVGADPNTPVQGIAPGCGLHQTLLQDLPELDEAQAQHQVLLAAKRLLQLHPQVNTLVLECTNLPPYAAAVQRALGLPVLDVVTMLNTRMAQLKQA